MSEVLYDIMLCNDFQTKHVESPLENESENSDKNEKEESNSDDEFIRSSKTNNSFFSSLYKGKYNSGKTLFPQFCKRIPDPPPDH